MKKLLCILLATFLCLYVVSCTDTPEITPNEIEPVTPEIVTPNEVETVEPIVTPAEPVTTPNEIETPTEPETPEVVTPTEQPHEPTEEPEVTEPEADEPEENVIILPAPDENTIELTIGIPQDFIDKPYTVCKIPELTPPENFEWGQYLPFISATHYYSQSLTTPYFSILSEKCKTLADGKSLYQKINEKYLIEYEGERTASKLVEYITDEYLNYLYKSRIVYISQDASIIGRFRLIPSDGAWWTGDWDGIYDVLKDGNVAYSEFRDSHDSSSLTSGDSPYIESGTLEKYYGYKDEYVAYDGTGYGFMAAGNTALVFKSVSTPTESKEILKIENKFNLNNTSDISQTTYYYYSVDGSKLMYVIDAVSDVILTLENGYTEHYTVGFNHAYGNNLSVSVSKVLYDTKGNAIEGTQSSYLYDLCCMKYEYIGDFLYGKDFSPNGKYLCFSPPNEPVLIDDENDPSFVLPKGCYVKNLENGTITFFGISPEDTRNTVVCIGWIDKDKLYKLINE